MDIRIAQPFGYSELGGRSNNEDSIFPDPQLVSIRQKWFLVCDGVGGAERGELASKLAATSLDAFMLQQPIAVPNDEYIQQAVAYVENQFNLYTSENPQTSGMATTLAMLYLHEAGATVAHIGDSRVYHVRNGKVIWRTDDHSYVNDLVKAGVLTPAEAHHHPQRNVITRALQGGERGVQASVQLINDLQPGDYFFLCSDGVLERIGDELLEGTLGNKAESNEQKAVQLRDYSLGNTRDNFTAYLIQINQVIGVVDATYQVAPAVYHPLVVNAGSDETITLINVPISDAVNVETLPYQAVQGTAPTREMSSVQPQPATQNRLTTGADRDTIRQVTPSLSGRSSNRGWVILSLVGVLLGAAGITVWQRTTNEVAVSTDIQRPATPVNQSLRKPYNQNSALSTAPTGAVAQTNRHGRAVSESPAGSSLASNAHNESSQLSKPSVNEQKKEPVATTLYPEPSDKVVRRVGKHLSVVRDSQTELVGLQKTSGQWFVAPIYTSIGPFENGVAIVKTNKGEEKYLTKEGKKFVAFEGYKMGIARLVGLNGEDQYLTKKGNWLDEMKPPSNERIAVRKGRYWGYLNLNGEISNNIQYDKVESFDNTGTAEVILKGENFRIDRQGNKIVSEGDSKSGKETNRE